MIQQTVILANGKFPDHQIPLGYLKNAGRVICCDGATEALINYGMEPFAIVGDCDSLNSLIVGKYKEKIFKDDSQDTNDLTKSVAWCSERGYSDIVILGATGKREDHTIGNISLLPEYAQSVNVIMVTDTGIFYPVLKSSKFDSFKGQKLSVFSINPETEITSSGLKYPLKRKKLRNWWEATLNEAAGDYFELDFTGGLIIVFLNFKE